MSPDSAPADAAKRKRAGPEEMCVVTPFVASWLSSFGYEFDGVKTLTEGQGAKDRAFSRSQSLTVRERIVESTDVIEAGNVVRFEGGDGKVEVGQVKAVRVEPHGNISYKGAILVRAAEVLGKVALAHEFYVTLRDFEVSRGQVKSRFDPAALLIRYEHDENRGPSWQDVTGTAMRDTVKPRYWPPSTTRPWPAIELNSTRYRKGDFICLAPAKTASLFDIVRVCDIQKTERGTSLLLRPTERDLLDRQHLHLASSKRTFAFDGNVARVVGKCRVLSAGEAQRFGDKGPFFWSNAVLNRVPSADGAKPPLKVLELYSGAGGLSLGFGQARQEDGSPTFDIKWAVERDAAAAKTFATAHPGARVMVKDASKVLEDTLSRADTVDVIAAGPPCQGFTGLNQQRGPLNPHNRHIFVVLSYVDVLRPRYVIVENVKDLANRGMVIGDQEQGFLKLILLVLMDLGYSVQVIRPNSGRYGAPQDRQRLIILASQGCRIPKLPAPLTLLARNDVGDKGMSVSLFPDQGKPRRDYFASGEWHGCALHRGLTSGDAISDLPEFDWKDPCQRVPISSHDKALRKRRQKSYSCNNDMQRVGKSLQPYATPPQNWFQRLVRSANELVSQHQTVRLNEIDTERVVAVPFRAGANSADWSLRHVDRAYLLRPQQIDRRIAERIQELGNAPQSAAFFRLDVDKLFPTICSASHPSSRNGLPLHPTCARTLTMRECARAQGFPDWVEFSGTESDVHRQIGNAVPVPLAAALGEAIWESWVASQPDVDQMQQSA